VILLQLKLIKLKLEILKSDLQHKELKKDMATDKLAINWKNLLEFDFSSSLLL